MAMRVERLKKHVRTAYHGLVTRLRVGLRVGEEGQSLVLIAFAFMGLLAFAGLAVDLGLVYVNRVQVSRAVDAASLAAVSDLPVEEAAQTRALTYLRDNGYDYSSPHTLWAADTFSTTSAGGVYGWNPNTPEDVTTVIWIDTQYSQDSEAAEPESTASRIRVRVKQMVPTVFMQFLGLKRVPVESLAEAENINRIDTVIVYDDSSSMEFTTVCYGCWEPDDDEMYPVGEIYPLHWSETSTMTADHCAGGCTVLDDSVVTDDNYSTYSATDYEYNNCHYRDPKDDVYTHTANYYDYHIVIEAEEYSSIHPEYQPLVGEPFHTFWVVQRNGRNAYYHDHGPGWSRGAYIRHHPYGSRATHFDGIALPCEQADVENGICVMDVPDWLSMPEEEEEYVEDILPQPVPRAEYDFKAPIDAGYYFWVRGQGGDGPGGHNNHIFWRLDDGSLHEEDGFPEQGDLWEGADPDDWQWRCLNEGTGGEWLSANSDHTLKLLAGGPGFSVDRILITTDSGGDPNDTIPLEPMAFPSNKGRTEWACHPCDPRFAGMAGGWASVYGMQPHCDMDTRLDPIYDDEQPIRNALEAAKYFVSRLDIRLDQVGYVSYDSSAHIEDELLCIRERGPETLDDPDCDASAEGIDPDCGCYQNVITNTILTHLDSAVASGGTNIPGAIDKGIQVLSTSGSHYGRPGAAHVMILLTDGETHSLTGVDCSGVGDLWPYNTGDSSVDTAKDCSIHYANQALDNGVAIYTIGLGAGADKPLLRAIADKTGGAYYPATQDNLNDVFDKLYERIFIRLIK
mgnify:CR=1 FL=1